MSNDIKTTNPGSGHRKRVFEKVNKFGFETFHDYELLEFILFAADPRKDTKPLAKSLLMHFSSFKNVMDATPLDLKAFGCSDRTIAVIASYKETIHRYNLESNKPGDYITCTQDAKNYIKALCGGLKTEHVYCIYLNPSKKILYTEKLAEGLHSHAMINSEHVLRSAIQLSAKYIIIGHNHPSGRIIPSHDDLDALNDLNTILNLVHIFIYDAVIATDYDAFSLVEHNFIKDNQINYVQLAKYDE